MNHRRVILGATYNGQNFRTPLEAQWAAFFDLADWNWRANPSRVGNWASDFLVSFPCSHSYCNGQHQLLIAVLPLSSIEQFTGHPCLLHCYGVKNERGHLVADGGVAFGKDSHITRWEISHGASGGIENVDFRVSDAPVLWDQAHH